MGLYLNQLPPAEVARLKAELAETLIAHFCYPRFFDYRVDELLSRPVDRAKRQEVWQYLNAVDFNVWGRVDIDSPDFQRQVERLFIHFVQRNRNFFGPQGRKRMADVRLLITKSSNALAEGLREHLQGNREHSSFGSPRPALSWSKTNISGQAEPSWEQISPGTMQLQQQLQELRNEFRSAAAPASSPQQVPGSGRAGNVPARRSRSVRSTANGATNGNREDEALSWPPPSGRLSKASEGRVPSAFPPPREAETAFPAFPQALSDAAPTMPLPLSKSESLPQNALETSAPPPVRPRRGAGRSSESSPFPATPASGPLRKTISQPLSSQQSLQAVGSTDLAAKAGESGTVLTSDEDIVIFEQLRHQLVVWLRVEAVRAGMELANQGAFQLIELLRHQDGMDASRLQVVSTLLTLCDQVIANSRATLFDYKQAMMFYLMHTRRTP